MKRDMFQKRATEGKPIYLHEFMYPLMQGYDSIVLDVDGEVGGNDQMFNMLVGRDLIKEIKNKEKFVITMKILEDSNGKKMGKTDGNAVSMLDNEFEMYGKVMSWTDSMMLRAFEISTFLLTEEIEKIKGQLENGVNPREIKGILAREIVKVYHGEEKAKKAEENFIETFKKGGIPEDIQEIKAEKGNGLCNIIVSNKIVSSNTEFRRLILAGAISDMKTGEKITNPNFKIEFEIILKIGKKNFVKILV
jgi:tyrosyl-tRNA synthetase